MERSFEAISEAMVKAGSEKAAVRSGRMRADVLAVMLAFAVGGPCLAQNAGKVAAEQHAVAIRAQIPAVFHMTPTTGSVSQLQNHIVITGPASIYIVKKSNVLIANYSTSAASDNPNDTSTINDSGKAIPLSAKCNHVVAVSLPGMTSPPVPDACRRDLALGKARMIRSGQRVLLVGVDLFVEKDVVEFTLLEHHKSLGVESPRFVSRFAVQFPSGFLMSADAGKIAEAIKPFLAPASEAVFQPYLPDAPAPAYSLEDNLSAALSPTVYQLEDETAGPGVTLHVLADRFMRAVPQGTLTMGCTPTLRDGRAKDPSFLCRDSGNGISVYMKPGDDLVVRAVKVESKKDKEIVRLEFVNLTQVDPAPQYDGSTGRYRGAVDIEFPKGTLHSGDVEKVKEQIVASFKIDGMALFKSNGAAVAGAADNSGGMSLELPAALNKIPMSPPGPPQTLEQQLKTFYKLTTVGDNAQVVARGTTLTVASDKLLLGTPYAKPTMCAASVVDGAAKPPAASCVTPFRPAIVKHQAAYFTKGQRLDVVAISVDMATETVAFSLIDDPAAGPNGAPRFHTMVKFVFPQGYLEGSDAGQVGGLVSSVLETGAGQA